MVEARVRALLKDTPEMPATVIAERVGWTGAVTWFALTRCTCTSSAREVGIADDLRHVAVALAQDGDVAFALSGALSGLGVAAAGLPYLVIYRTGPP